MTFTAGGTLPCVATTDGHGNAGCPSLAAVLAAVLNLGYTVTYAGTSVYGPSSAHGSAIGLDPDLLGEHGAGDRSSASHRGDHALAALRARVHRVGRARLARELRVLRLHDHQM